MKIYFRYHSMGSRRNSLLIVRLICGKRRDNRKGLADTFTDRREVLEPRYNTDFLVRRKSVLWQNSVIMRDLYIGVKQLNIGNQASNVFISKFVQ